MSVNEKLTLQDLVDLLAEKQGLTKKDADSFLRELIALISETIEEEEFVRIKKFGTFKRTKIKARKSIDVNTNESIEIPAHYRLTFVPDKELRDAVNRPFSHYESVLVEEGSPIEDEKDIIIDDNLAKKIKQVKIVSYPKGVEIPDSIPEHIFNQQEGKTEHKIEKNDIEDKQESKGSVTEEENTVALSPDITSIEKTEEKITTLASTESDEEIPEEEIAPLPLVTQIEDRELEKEGVEEPTKKRKLTPLLLICFLILIGIGIYWWYPSQTKPTTSLTTEEPHQNKESGDNVANKDIALTGDSTNIGKAEISTDSEQITEEEAQYQETEIKYDDTMRKLGQKYFGHRSFWVYIYEENKNIIENPNAVPIGTKLRIPPASKYNIDPKNPESVKKAKELEEKLFQKFNL